MARTMTIAPPTLLASDVLEAAGHTVKGPVRPTNQDTLLVLGPGLPIVDDADRGYLFAVIDGLGRKGGAVAAEIARETLLEYYSEPGDAGPERLERLLHEANRRIIAETFRRLELRRMGAVFSCLWTDGRRTELLHAGDSRVYGFVGDEMIQLTEDEADERGRVRNHLGHPRMAVRRRELPANRYGAFLLCSDGLTKEVGDARILDLVGRSGAPDVAVTELLKAALAAGGRDNATVVCVSMRSGSG